MQARKRARGRDHDALRRATLWKGAPRRTVTTRSVVPHCGRALRVAPSRRGASCHIVEGRSASHRHDAERRATLWKGAPRRTVTTRSVVPHCGRALRVATCQLTPKQFVKTHYNKGEEACVPDRFAAGSWVPRWLRWIF